MLTVAPTGSTCDGKHEPKVLIDTTISVGVMKKQGCSNMSDNNPFSFRWASYFNPTRHYCGTDGLKLASKLGWSQLWRCPRWLRAYKSNWLLLLRLRFQFSAQNCSSRNKIASLFLLHHKCSWFFHLAEHTSTNELILLSFCASFIQSTDLFAQNKGFRRRKHIRFPFQGWFWSGQTAFRGIAESSAASKSSIIL